MSLENERLGGIELSGTSVGVRRSRLNLKYVLSGCLPPSGQCHTSTFSCTM